jgi:enoyl-CoA hydratase
MAVDITRDGAVAIVTVNRPDALNALNTETNELLLAAASQLSVDEDVRAVVLTGAGDKAFVAGADVAEMQAFTPSQAEAFALLGHRLCTTIEGAPQPWIAAVNGFALGGGCELALACDIRYAAAEAKFGQPEVGLGITPGFGGTQRLPRVVGPGWAAYLVLSGRHVRAEEALRIGLVQAVFPRAELMDKAMKLAVEIAARSRLTLQACKAAVQTALDVDLASGLEIETEIFSDCFATADQKEGMAAFLERRVPRFRGK